MLFRLKNSIPGKININVDLIEKTLKNMSIQNQSALREKSFYKKGEFWVGAILGIASIVLAILAMIQTNTISKQQSQIQGFDDLLTKQQTQITNLDKVISSLHDEVKLTNSQNKLIETELGVLISQLAINTKNQKDATAANIYHLYSTTVTLNWLAGNISSVDSAGMVATIKRAKELLEQELTNPFLVKTDSVFKYWFNAYQNTAMYHYIGTMVKIESTGNQVWMSEQETKAFNLKEFSTCLEILFNTVFKTIQYLRKTNPNLTISIIRVPKT